MDELWLWHRMDRKKFNGVANSSTVFDGYGAAVYFLYGPSCYSTDNACGYAAVAPQSPKEQEVAMLESQAEMLEQQLEQIKKRLEDIIT